MELDPDSLELNWSYAVYFIKNQIEPLGNREFNYY